MKIYGERCIYTYNACFVHVGDLNNRHTRRGPKCTNVVGGTWVSYPFFGARLDAYKGPRPRGRCRWAATENDAARHGKNSYYLK